MNLMLKIKVVILIKVVVSNMDFNHIALSSAPVEGQLLPPEQFYYKWSQLNGVQEHSLNFIMTV